MNHRILRAVVYLTYEEVPGDGDIRQAQTPHEAERDIKNQLSRVGSPFTLKYRPDKVEVVDAEYLTPEQADQVWAVPA